MSDNVIALNRLFQRENFDKLDNFSSRMLLNFRSEKKWHRSWTIRPSRFSQSESHNPREILKIGLAKKGINVRKQS